MERRDTINIKEHNKDLLNQVRKQINLFEQEASSTYNHVTIIDGRRIPESKLELFKKYAKLERLLNFVPDANSKYMIFDGLVTTTDRYYAVMRLLNDRELVLDLPDELHMYGHIPELGIETPRPIKFNETVEHYEEYLERYYKKNNITPEIRNDGVRAPYPHEEYKWEKGVATKPNAHYVSPYYKRLRMQILKQQQEEERKNTRENHEAKHEAFTRRQYTNPDGRNKASHGRYRIKRRVPLREHLNNLGNRFKNLDHALGNPETVASSVKIIKRTGCVILIVGIGFAALQFLVPTLLIPFVQSIGYLPKGILTAITGAGINIHGTKLTPGQVSSIRGSLLTLMLSIGGIAFCTYAAKHHLKKAKEDEKEEEKESTKEEQPKETFEQEMRRASLEILKAKLKENRDLLEAMEREKALHSTGAERIKEIKTQRRELERQRRIIMEQLNQKIYEQSMSGGFTK